MSKGPGRPRSIVRRGFTIWSTQYRLYPGRAAATLTAGTNMLGGKLFRTLVLGGIAAAGCGSGGGARSGGRGGAAVDAAGRGELGGGSGSTGGAPGAVGDMAGSGGGGGMGGAGGTGGAGAAGNGGESDASAIPDATF